RSRPRDADLRAVRHFKHEFVCVTIIRDVRDASPIGTRWPLLSLLPLRPLRANKVHEQGPRPILLAKQIAAGRVQVDVAFFPQRSPGVRASMQKIHTSAISSTVTSNRDRIARRNMDNLPVGTQKFEQAILAHSFSPPLRLAPLRSRRSDDEGGVSLDASSATFCSASLRLRRLN